MRSAAYFFYDYCHAVVTLLLLRCQFMPSRHARADADIAAYAAAAMPRHSVDVYCCAMFCQEAIFAAAPLQRCFAVITIMLSRCCLIAHDTRRYATRYARLTGTIMADI